MTSDAPAKQRCAIIYNPTKISDRFRELVEAELSDDGYAHWSEPLWLETSSEDPGYGMTAEAVTAKVDLVIGAGGDGTVRIIAGGLAETDIPFGLIPAGTGNLLARNLGIPLDEKAAISVAFADSTRKIDLIKLDVDGREEHFAVMAGVGFDAVIMDSTDENLKKRVGSAAYFAAAAKHVGRKPMHATVQVDDGEPIRRRATVCLIGNVGELLANISLIPEAEPDDGLLDVLVASPRRVKHWLRLVLSIITRQRRSDDGLDHIRGTKVKITIRETEKYQLDGDTVGECSSMTAEVQHHALTIKAPAS